MSPDRCDVTRPWRSMRGVPFGCRMIARNWYRVLKASIANTFPEKSSSLRGSRTTISERLIPIGRRKGCSTQVPFDRGRALGVLWLSRVTRLHREFRFRSDTKGFELSDEHKRTSTNESLLYHIPRQYPPVGGYGVTESPRERERSAVASECRLGLASRGGYRDRVPRSGPWVSRRRPMLPAILVIASLIAGIPLIARSASADGFIQDLGSLDSFSHARAVNELGQIVGESTNDDFRNPRATLWENGTMTDLGSLGGGTAFANDVNEAGQIVGGTTDASGYQRAFLWENGVMTDLGVQPDGSALAINDKGQIVGTMNGERQGFLWDHGTITDLGTLGGPPVSASGVNNAGQIVGWSGSTSGSAFRPWLWENGTLTDLGTPVGFTWGQALDINEAGQVAGFGFNATGSARALLWSGGQMTDLGDLGGGISLAFGLDDAGQIVDPKRKADPAPEVPQIRHLAPGPQERPCRAGRIETEAGDLAGLVDVEGLSPRESNRSPKVGQGPVFPQPRAERAAGRAPAPPDDLSRVVDSTRIYRWAAEGPEVRDRPVVPEESLALSVHRANDLALVVDRQGGPIRLHAEIRHDAILPKEGSLVTRRIRGAPDDLASLVHIIREGGPAAEAAQVGHRPVLPEGRTRVPEVVVCALAHDLAQLVDRACVAERIERSKVLDETVRGRGSRDQWNTGNQRSDCRDSTDRAIRVSG